MKKPMIWKISKLKIVCLLVAATAILGSGCEKKSPVEKVVDNTKSAVESVGDKVKDAADKTKDAVKDTTQKVVDAGKQGAQKVQSAATNLVSEIKQKVQ